MAWTPLIEERLTRDKAEARTQNKLDKIKGARKLLLKIVQHAYKTNAVIKFLQNKP